MAPGAIVFARAAREPGIYIGYEDSTAASLAPGGTMPDVSPQGDLISYVRNDREIWLMHPNGSGREMIAKVADPGFKVAAAPRWSPDGKHLAFELIEGKRQWLHSSSYQSYSNIYLLDIQTGEFTRHTEGTDIENHARGPVAWTLAGNMVVMRDDKLYLLKKRNTELLYKREERPQPTNVIPWPPGPPKCKDPARSPSGLIIFAQDHERFHARHEYDVGCISRRRFSGGNQRKGSFIEDLPHPVATPRVLADDLTVVYASGDAIYRVTADPKGLFTMHRGTPASESEPPVRVIDNASDPVPVLHHWSA